MIHKSEKTVEKMAKLRENMDKAGVESIDQNRIEKWRAAFDEIEKGYREEMRQDWCNEFGVEFGTLFTAYDGVQVVEEAEALVKERPIK
jgi:tRNA splicing endonuclease